MIFSLPSCGSQEIIYVWFYKCLVRVLSDRSIIPFDLASNGKTAQNLFCFFHLLWASKKENNFSRFHVDVK